MVPCTLSQLWYFFWSTLKKCHIEEKDRGVTVTLKKKTVSPLSTPFFFSSKGRTLFYYPFCSISYLSSEVNMGLTPICHDWYVGLNKLFPHDFFTKFLSGVGKTDGEVYPSLGRMKDGGFEPPIPILIPIGRMTDSVGVCNIKSDQLYTPLERSHIHFPPMTLLTLMTI